MSILKAQDCLSSFFIKNVPIINDKNQLICFCGQPMMVKDKKNGRVGCAKNKCKFVLDQYALTEWVKSGALPDLPAYHFPICRACTAVTLYAPMRNSKDDDGSLRPLFKCDCRNGKLASTYYSERDYPEFYKQFDSTKYPMDLRPRPERPGEAPSFNIMNLPDA